MHHGIASGRLLDHPRRHRAHALHHGFRKTPISGNDGAQLTERRPQHLIGCRFLAAFLLHRQTADFLDLIRKYTEENEIERPMDITIKTVANKSKTKVSIIQAIDRKIPLEDIAKSNDMTWGELMDELYGIVASGTKLRLDYYLTKNLDEYVRETVLEYFAEAETDDLDVAHKELKEEEITWEEIQVMRLKFLSDNAN